MEMWWKVWSLGGSFFGTKHSLRHKAEPFSSPVPSPRPRKDKQTCNKHWPWPLVQSNTEEIQEERWIRRHPPPNALINSTLKLSTRTSPSSLRPSASPDAFAQRGKGLSSIQDRHTDQSDPDGLASDDDDVDRRKSTGLSTEHKRRNASRRSLLFLRL